MTLLNRAAPLSLVILFLLAPSAGHADLLTGGETTYTITKGDSLILIAAKVGVDWQILAREGDTIAPHSQRYLYYPSRLQYAREWRNLAQARSC